MNTHGIRAVATRSGLIAVLALGLAATVSAADAFRFEAALLSTNELHATDADGSGEASVRVDPEAGMVCFDIEFEDSGTPNRAHIHAGDASTAGPIVVPFFDIHTAATVFDPRHEVLESRQRIDGCVTVTDPVLLANIAANPQNFYVNLHNARFPAGSMRGQLDD